MDKQKTLTRCGYCWRDEDRKPYYWDEDRKAMVSAETNEAYKIVRHIVEDECTVRENT